MISPLSGSKWYHSSPRSTTPALVFSCVHSITARSVSGSQMISSTVQCEPSVRTAQDHFAPIVSPPRNGPSYMSGGK